MTSLHIPERYKADSAIGKRGFFTLRPHQLFLVGYGLANRYEAERLNLICAGLNQLDPPIPTGQQL